MLTTILFNLAMLVAALLIATLPFLLSQTFKRTK